MIVHVDGQMAKAVTGRQTEDLLVNPPWARRRVGGAGVSRGLKQEGTGMGKSDARVSREQGMFGEEEEQWLEAAKRRKGVNPTLINTFADPVAGAALARTQSLHKSFDHAREDT